MSEAYIDQLKRKVASLEQTLHDQMFVPATKWGNCKRGCPPSYLDKEDFCSPACKLGAPRGEFVTVANPLPSGNGLMVSNRIRIIG